MALWQWSTTPANNASAATAINWAEGQPPSSVNDSARQMMADVAVWYQNGPEWLNYGLTPTYVSATQFTVAGNQTAIYTVGRRVRAFVAAGTIYGTISSSVFTSATAVSVNWDSGSLDSGVSEVDVGFANPSYSSIEQLSGNFTARGGSVYAGSASLSGEAHYGLLNTNTNGYYFLTASGLIGFFDATRTLTRFQSDTSGNMTVAGNFSANSDERLKKDWSLLVGGFVEKLSHVKSGTYSRTDINQRQVGVSAQSLREILPEAVQEDSRGTLSVAYGQAALAACVELAKEITRLRALIETKK